MNINEGEISPCDFKGGYQTSVENICTIKEEFSASLSSSRQCLIKLLYKLIVICNVDLL